MTQKKSVTRVSPEKARELINNKKNLQIVDVRTSSEYLSGSIQNAQNVDVYSSSFNDRMQDFDKESPILVYCKSGGRSHMASEKLQAMGFEKIFDLEGGLMLWTSKKYPLNKSKTQGSMSVKEFNRLSKMKNVVIFDFKAKWCGPCRLLSPILDSLQTSLGKENLGIVEIDVDEESFITQHFKIESIPFLMFYKKGQLVLTQKGFQPAQKEDLIAKIKGLLP